MAEDRPLPTPPKSPFAARVPNSATQPLVMEKIEQALTEGRLNEFLNQEFGGDEPQRKMAELMMGFMGMAPTSPGEAPPSSPSMSGSGKERVLSFDTTEADPAKSTAAPPGIIAAAERGDVAGLIRFLSMERDRRAGPSEHTGAVAGQTDSTATREQHQETAASHFDQATLNALISMSRENSVSIDWLVFRAIKLYVMEYGRTGRL